jgi:hypothetical protein
MGLTSETDEMGLLYYISKIKNYLVESILRTLPKADKTPDEIFERKRKNHSWTDSKLDFYDGELAIIDSISWYRGKVNILDIARDIPKIDWPSEDDVILDYQGGSPEKEETKVLDGIVCYALKYKVRWSEYKIAKAFDSDAPLISQSRRKSTHKSTTIKSRLALGHKFMKLLTQSKNTK